MINLFTTIVCCLSQHSASDFAKMLDIDGDGVISPMEAADAIDAFGLDDGTPGIYVDEVNEILDEEIAYKREYAMDYISEFDENGDRQLQFSEVPEEYEGAAHYLDLNSDSVITLDEIVHVEVDGLEVYAANEVHFIFKEFDAVDAIALDFIQSVDEEFYELVSTFDEDDSKTISREEFMQGFLALDSPAAFDIDGDRAIMTGIIGPSTPYKVMELIFNHPEVKTIVMQEVPGSMDDDSCLRAARMVRSHGLNTHVPSDGSVESGGTDFFQSGVERTCEKGAKFGIHSWGDFGSEGREFPKDSEVHEMYLEYCDDMGIPRSFYWRTLDAAGFDDIHYMTDEELKKYKMLTSPIE